MNDEKQKVEVKQMMDFLSCEHLSDKAFCQYHCALLALLSPIIESKALSLPMSLYRQYKGFVKLSCKMYQKMQSGELTDLSSSNLQEMFLCYRQQAEEKYKSIYERIKGMKI